jgi:hypothetical protein
VQRVELCLQLRDQPAQFALSEIDLRVDLGTAPAAVAVDVDPSAWVSTEAFLPTETCRDRGEGGDVDLGDERRLVCRGADGFAPRPLMFSFARAVRRAPVRTPHPGLLVADGAGQTFAALSGANFRELMAGAGQSSPGAALRYTHEVENRQREIADRLSAYAGG